jgi:hypothetical protein
VVRRVPATRAVATRTLTPCVGGATITRVLARAIAAWAAAPAVTLYIRAGPGVVGLDPRLAVADRAPGGFGRVLLGFLLGAPRP